MPDLIIAIDLGGTQIRAALCDPHGRILNRARPQLTGALDGPEAVFSRIAASVREVVEDWAFVRGIGLGGPGTIDPWDGVLFEATNLPGMIDFPMKARLEKEFGVSAFVGNDANLAALGEQRYGAGRGVKHMIYMTISTGVGGGIITDGKLYLGWRGFAGEVGHQTLDVHGPLCICGNIGCLEVLAAGPAILRDARAALHGGRDSKLRVMVDGDLETLTGPMVMQAAREGDALARELYARAGFYIGLEIVNSLHAFDSQLFVLGGSVAVHAWDFLYPAMVAALDKHAMPSMRNGVRIVQAQLGDDVGLLGAAAWAMDNVPTLAPRASAGVSQ